MKGMEEEKGGEVEEGTCFAGEAGIVNFQMRYMWICELSVVVSGVKIRQKRSFDLNDELRDVIQNLSAVYDWLKNRDNIFNRVKVGSIGKVGMVERSENQLLWTEMRKKRERDLILSFQDPELYHVQNQLS